MIGIEKKSGTVKGFDGTPIYYEVRGEGKPLFLCYGIACLSNHWHNQITYFSQNYQTIVIDYRAHHQTPSPNDVNNLSIEAIARDLVSVADHLNIERASFWSHSFGSQVLLATFEEKPELFENMIIVNGFAKNPIQGMFGMNVVPVIEKLRVAYETLPETFLWAWNSLLENPIASRIVSVTGGFNANLTSFKDIEIYLRGVKSISFPMFLNLFEKMMKYDGRHVLPNIHVPTLIIGGTKDAVTPKEFQDELHASIAGSELQMIPYGSHCSQLDMPDLVNLRIEKFLQKHAY